MASGKISVSAPRRSAVVLLACLVFLVACGGPATVESLRSATSTGAAAPSNFRVQNYKNGVELDWQPVDKAQGYEIQFSDDGANWELLTESTINVDDGSRFGGYSTDSGFEAGSTQFRIRAVLGADAVTEWSQAVALDGGSTLASGCVDAMRRAASDQAGTAEEAYRDSVNECRTVDEWISAANMYRDAFSVGADGKVDHEWWLGAICMNNPDAVLCRLL